MTKPSSRPEELLRIVDDVLVERDLHGLSPRVARDLQLAASAITHERFRILMAELARLLEEAQERRQLASEE